LFADSHNDELDCKLALPHLDAVFSDHTGYGPNIILWRAWIWNSLCQIRVLVIHRLCWGLLEV